MSELNGPRGDRWPNSLHRLAVNSALTGGPSAPAGRLLTDCLGPTDEVIIAALHLTGSAGLYYCTNGEVGADHGY